MILTASDDRNFQMVMDALQAKHLVALLTIVVSNPECMQYLIAASEQVNKDGFESLGTDTMAAALSLVSVLGFWTTQLKRVPEPEQAKPEDNPSAVIPGNEDSDKKEEVPPKPLVN